MARSIEGTHLLQHLFPVPGSQMRVADDALPPSIWVSLHTGPVGRHIEVAPAGSQLGSTEWTRVGSACTANLIESIEVYDASWSTDPDHLLNLSYVDATPTGIGDPLAGVLRAINELLEQE